MVEQLRGEGTTVLLTTHYLDEAERLADRVAVVAGGRLVACAPSRSRQRWSPRSAVAA